MVLTHLFRNAGGDAWSPWNDPGRNTYHLLKGDTMKILSDDTHIGYVITDRGTILVQRPDNTEHGFSLFDDEQSWSGGFGVASTWEAIPAADPRITAEDHERLDWILLEDRDD